MFTEQELGKLANQTDRELAQRWKGMEKKLAAKNTITIANTGLVNSGKSSLFNALLADTHDTERFPVGAVRTTKHGDREHLSDGVDIVDTPGIDAADEDDNVAFETLMAADLIVATHNIKMGMLNKSEYDWLARLAQGMKKDEIKQRIIFACTWIDERDQDAEVYQSAVEETKRQVFEALGAEVPVWEVSAKRYMTARKKGKKGLEQASKIPAFKEFLLKRAAKAGKTAAVQRQKAFQELCAETAKKLKEERQTMQRAVDDKRRKIHARYAPAYQSWGSIFGNFRSKKGVVEGKLKELKGSDSSVSSLNSVYSLFGQVSSDISLSSHDYDAFYEKIKRM